MRHSWTTIDIAPSTRRAIAGLVDAINETRPDDAEVDDWSEAIRNGVLDVSGHGTGLWDDYHESWNGHGRAWSDALRKDPRVKGFRDSEGLIVGDDGMIHAYGIDVVG